ncbi:MAG: hypothetical protein A3D93_06865 [Acidobacteria bacterium RIFCSPHIGHO2_12_FULL_67_30]|nr:MAG: hypothetical protein A3D93_06865 [Acidobacteria bacterium RIFCSPHIGHO2_12_FULL_67_30]
MQPLEILPEVGRGRLPQLLDVVARQAHIHPGRERLRVEPGSEDHADALFEFGFGLVGELHPVRGDELDAVVAVGVVGGADHGAGREPAGPHQARDGRRRQHAR